MVPYMIWAMILALLMVIGELVWIVYGWLIVGWVWVWQEDGLKVNVYVDTIYICIRAVW